MIESDVPKVFGTKAQIVFSDFLISVGLKNLSDYLIPRYKVKSPIGGVKYPEDDRPFPDPFTSQKKVEEHRV